MEEMIIREANKHNTVIITYISKDNSYSRREIEPYEIRDNYLFAYCLLNNGLRKFNIDNIQDVEITNNKFYPRWDIKI